MGARPHTRAAIPSVLGLWVVLALGGCASSVRVHPYASPTGFAVYVVRPGDTLFSIAQRHRVSVWTLAQRNGIGDPRKLRVGQRLLIPLGRSVAIASLGSPTRHSASYLPAPKRLFAWPVRRGVVSSGFGPRNGTMHDGIDIAAAPGTPVPAAGTGVVIFAGQMHGYGNVVIIQHSGGFVTVYGHDSVNLVYANERVRAGQVIGEVGRTGRTTGPNLHFEVRYNNIARNPLYFLPASYRPSPATFARNAGG